MGIFLGGRVAKGVYVGMRGKDAAIGLLIMLLIGLACLGWIIEFIKEYWGLLLFLFGAWIAWISYTVRRDARRAEEASQ